MEGEATGGRFDGLVVVLIDGTAVVNEAIGSEDDPILGLNVIGRTLGKLVTTIGISVRMGVMEGVMVVVGSIEGNSLGELSNVGSKVGIIVETGRLVIGAFVGRGVGLLVGQVLHTEMCSAEPHSWQPAHIFPPHRPLGPAV